MNPAVDKKSSSLSNIFQTLYMFIIKLCKKIENLWIFWSFCAKMKNPLLLIKRKEYFPCKSPVVEAFILCVKLHYVQFLSIFFSLEGPSYGPSLGWSNYTIVYFCSHYIGTVRTLYKQILYVVETFLDSTNVFNHIFNFFLTNTWNYQHAITDFKKLVQQWKTTHLSDIPRMS